MKLYEAIDTVVSCTLRRPTTCKQLNAAVCFYVLIHTLFDPSDFFVRVTTVVNAYSFLLKIDIQWPKQRDSLYCISDGPNFLGHCFRITYHNN